MLSSNALVVLNAHSKVGRSKFRYKATFEKTGAVVTFDDRDGHVARLSLHKRCGVWSPRSLTTAVRSALTQGKTLAVTLGPMSGLLVSVGLGACGQSFEPVASFIVMDLTGGANHLKGANDDWDDPEAIQTAVAAIEGRVAGTDLVNWLVARGGGIAGFAVASRWPSSGDYRRDE